jgi:outer membrane protein OmpA-like peptidoglycan-associated protein
MLAGAALLTGLFLTGLVEEGAIASSRHISSGGPATVEVRIENEATSITRVLYFSPDSIDLTPQAHLALMEITLELASLENASVSLSSQDGDRLLSYERINTVAEELQRSGIDPSRLFTWSEHDMLSAGEL